MLLAIGPLFPRAEREKFADRNLKIGAVLKMFVPETKPPKPKRFIVVGLSTNSILVATIYINTEINPNLFPTEDLWNLHLELKVSGKEYLEYDSFADCSQIYKKEFNDLRNELIDDPSIHIDQLSQTDIENVQNLIRSARTISIKTKSEFNLL